MNVCTNLLVLPHSSGLYKQPAEGLLVLYRCLLIPNRVCLFGLPPGQLQLQQCQIAAACAWNNHQDLQEARWVHYACLRVNVRLCWLSSAKPLGLLTRCKPILGTPTSAPVSGGLNNKFTVGQHRFYAGACVISVHSADGVQLYLFVYAQLVSAHMHHLSQGGGHIILCRCCSDTWCLFSGAVRLQTPLFLPRNRKLYDGSEVACFMDHSGMLVTLPYDLRVSQTHTRTCTTSLTIQLFASAHANTHRVWGCNQQPP